jgi:hypothetical protein
MQLEAVDSRPASRLELIRLDRDGRNCRAESDIGLRGDAIGPIFSGVGRTYDIFRRVETRASE